MTDYPQRDAAVRAFQKRRAAQRRAEAASAKGGGTAINPPVNRDGRDPIFSELDRRIAEEAEQARRRIARAANASYSSSGESPSGGACDE
jgi:hypothetical protein